MGIKIKRTKLRKMEMRMRIKKITGSEPFYDLFGIKKNPTVSVEEIKKDKYQYQETDSEL